MAAESTAESAALLIPDFALRSRVAGAAQTEEDYRMTGMAGITAMNDALAHLEKTIADFTTVLDFGCGPARVLQHLRQPGRGQELHGADIDPEAIGWCREHIDYAVFETNAALPPLPYPDRKFDFIYALSVFSHLDKEMQQAWLSEMARLLRPGAPLYLTFSGRFVFDRFREDFPPEAIREFDASGFTFIHNMGAEFYRYPQWYQTSLQDMRFLAGELPKDLQIVYYAARGHTGWQDALLCVKH
jgi:SAM-dependent methyltransferase